MGESAAEWGGARLNPAAARDGAFVGARFRGCGNATACRLRAMSSPAQLAGAISPYATRMSLLYVLIVTDASINATADANTQQMTTAWASLILVGQVFVRICCVGMVVAALSTSRTWRDDFLLEFCGVFAVSLVGIIVLLFLRVYCVVLASFPSTFPSVIDYWGSSEYCLLLLTHVLLSLLFYYTSIMAAFRAGRLKYFYNNTEHASTAALQDGGTVPSVYNALHLAAMRR